MKALDVNEVIKMISLSRIEEKNDIINEWLSKVNDEFNSFPVECKNAELLKEVTEGKRFFNVVIGTDVISHLITKVINKKTIEVMKLGFVYDWRKSDIKNAHIIGSQDWLIYINDSRKSDITTFTLRKDGSWVEKGKLTKHGIFGQISESPRNYYDWSF